MLASKASAISVIRDAETEAMLRDYGNPIFKAAGLNPSDISITILGDPALNAFVTDGQSMYIHTGLILAADTPDQLKGVMAHETGHIAGGHLSRSSEAMGKAMIPMFASIGLGVLAMAAGAPDAGAALIGGSSQFAMATFVRHTQVQESSADQAAVTFLDGTHQSPEGLLRFFEKFRYQEVMSTERRIPYFQTHPLSSDRIEALRVRVDKSPYRDAKDTQADLDRFKMIQAKLYGFLQMPAAVFVKYPETDQSIPARYARAVAYYRSSDMAKAASLMQSLTVDEPNNPYFYEMWGQILFESAKAADSIDPNRRALALNPQNALLQINLARSLNAVGGEANVKEAIGLLQRAVALESDNAFAWRELAAAYDRSGQGGMARLASAEESFALRDYSTAINFAQRAKKDLPEGSASWRRASDIALVSEAERKQKRS